LAKASLWKQREIFSFSFDEKPPERGQAPGHFGVCIDYPVIGIFDLTKASLWKQREVFSSSFDEKPTERGQVRGKLLNRISLAEST